MVDGDPSFRVFPAVEQIRERIDKLLALSGSRNRSVGAGKIAADEGVPVKILRIFKFPDFAASRSEEGDNLVIGEPSSAESVEIRTVFPAEFRIFPHHRPGFIPHLPDQPNRRIRPQDPFHPQARPEHIRITVLCQRRRQQLLDSISSALPGRARFEAGRLDKKVLLGQSPYGVLFHSPCGSAGGVLR